MADMIKVAMICHFSNQAVHQRLPLSLSIVDKIINRLKKRPSSLDVDDFAIWNTNAIKEMEHLNNTVELHVIAPYPYLKPKTYEYCENGIFYHFYRNDDAVNEFIQRNILKKWHLSYKRERCRVSSFINAICPDIIHIIGAENPYYSISALDVPAHIPVIVQLQTLMSDPAFEAHYSIGHDYYLYRSKIERKVISRADYIGTTVDLYKNFITERINRSSFLNITLPLSEPIKLVENEKKFDFVYFAADISKAADFAIESFIIASKIHPGITLDIIGGYKTEYRQNLEKRISEAGLLGRIFFEGKLPSHEDVINQIRYSRFALLPLKIDLISGTVREAMANGLPVVTTITPSTPKLNENRDCVLLSRKGDFTAMAKNMCRLIESSQLADVLRNNGWKYMQERTSNATIIKRWVDAYHKILLEKSDN